MNVIVIQRRKIFYDKNTHPVKNTISPRNLMIDEISCLEIINKSLNNKEKLKKLQPWL